MIAMTDVLTALVGIGGALLGGAVTWFAVSKRIDADNSLAKQKFEFDKELARQKFELERLQIVHKRRFDLAEALLADVYRFRDLMAFVRNGAAFGKEGQTRQGEDYEDEHLKHSRDIFFVPIERLQKESEFIGALMAKESTARAHFGPDATKALGLLSQTSRTVQISAGMLIQLSGQPMQDQKFLEDLRKDIWAPLASVRNGRDEIAIQIEEAVKLVESFCRPALDWKGA